MRILMFTLLTLIAGSLVAQTPTTQTMDNSDEDMNETAEPAAKASDSSGSKTVCTGGGEERVIEIIYETAGSKIPCKVEYTKGGQTSTLWQAANEEGYCESKVQGLIEKLSNSGFECK